MFNANSILYLLSKCIYISSSLICNLLPNLYFSNDSSVISLSTNKHACTPNHFFAHLESSKGYDSLKKIYLGRQIEKEKEFQNEILLRTRKRKKRSILNERKGFITRRRNFASVYNGGILAAVKVEKEVTLIEWKEKKVYWRIIAWDRAHALNSEQPVDIYRSNLFQIYGRIVFLGNIDLLIHNLECVLFFYLAMLYFCMMHCWNYFPARSRHFWLR